MWAVEHYGVEPDLLVAGKSLGGGLPLASVTGRAELMDAPAPGGLGGTFGGNPVACAAALATLDAAAEDSCRSARDSATASARRLERIAPAGSDVRGLGPMLALELAEQTPDRAAAVVAAARERGLVLLSCGLYGNVIRLHVPFVDLRRRARARPRRSWRRALGSAEHVPVADVEVAARARPTATSSRSTTSTSRSAPGTFFTLLGPSGSGKTTTLRMIAGFERPDAGTIRLGGDDITGPAAVRARRQHRLPGLRALPAHDRRRERRLRAAREGRRRAPSATARVDEVLADGAPRRVRRPQAGPALGRPAPARRARARDRQPAAGAAARRAARRARPEAAPGDAGLPEVAPARARDDVHLRHARPGGGADDERPDRRLQRGPDRAGRRRRPRSTSGRRPSSSPASSARRTSSSATAAACCVRPERIALGGRRRRAGDDRRRRLRRRVHALPRRHRRAASG